MKKLLIFITVISLLLVSLTSCSDNGTATSDTTTGTQNAIVNNVEIDLSDYTVIRNEYASSSINDKILELISSVQARCGVRLKYTDDFIGRNETEKDDAKEIIIGLVNRTASRDAYMSMEGSGFTVRLVGNRIIILGSDDTKTISAIDYFIENYVMAISENKLILPENLCYNSEMVSNIEIIKSSQSEFTVIYSDGVDKTGSVDSSATDRPDLELKWSSEISNAFTKLVGKSIIKIDTDWVKKGSQPKSETYEILVGETNRSELVSVKQELGYDDYTVRVVGNKIIIFGWNLTTLELAVEHFKSMIQGFSVKSDDGTVNLFISSDYSYTASVDQWLTDFPSYDGGKFVSAHDTNNGALTFVYHNTNESDFSAYAEKLTAGGYSLYMSNKIGDVLSATYTKDTQMIHIYYTPAQSSVHIITDRETELMPSEPQQIEKICDMSLTQMRLAYDAENFGMCYILTLEDGSFIIYDGGGAKGGDHVRLHGILSKLNRCNDGKIDIAAWIITHSHWDHYSVFKMFFDTYAASVTCDAVIINMPGENERYNSADSFDSSGETTIPQIAQKIGARLIVPYTAQAIYIRNVKMDVLFTHDAMFPGSYGCQNNTSTVTRFTVGEQNITLLGDIQLEASTAMTNMYGDALQSDIVQVAHHSSPGATMETYKKIAPKVLLWPVDNVSFQNHTNMPDASSYHYKVNYALRYTMNVQEILLADFTNKTIPLPYTANSGTLVEWE